jgi:hypothetical protein
MMESGRHILGKSCEALVCIIRGHKDLHVTLQLGKIDTEQVQATKCSRCGRISILKSELRKRKG